jgi:type IV pilus assembly protein PilM
LPLLDYIQRWIKEPPPEYLIELSEGGVASVQTRNASTLRVAPFSEKALAVSPVEPNILRPELVQSALGRNGNGNTPRRARAALVIPDYAARVSVLDFDEVPNDEAQRLALVRFRLRKSVPFSIDEAQVSSVVQPKDAQGKTFTVLAAAIARPVLESYEALLQSLGYQAGLVLPSSLAVLSLCAAAPGVLTLLAKLSGAVLSLLLLEDRYIHIVRSVDLSSEENLEEERQNLIAALLQQTLAFAEDELNRPVQRLLLCGFGPDAERTGLAFEKEFGVSWTPLRSRLGVASQENAGILGLLERYAV